jgi:hypothetical protein
MQAMQIVLQVPCFRLTYKYYRSGELIFFKGKQVDFALFCGSRHKFQETEIMGIHTWPLAHSSIHSPKLYNLNKRSKAIPVTGRVGL